MATLWCITFVLVAPLAVGLPVLRLIGGRRPLDEEAWLASAFFGIGVIVLLLQNLLYWNIPIRISIFFLWGIVLALWLVVVRQGGLREDFRQFPRRLAGVCLLVYCVQGAGLFFLGAEGYVGRAWLDMFNYVNMTDFFNQQGFHLEWKDVACHPHLFLTRGLIDLRIGQCILLGQNALAAGLTCKAAFMPTILLGCPLVVLAVYASARAVGLSRNWSLLAGALAGLLPSLTMLQLESYLSHVLGIPYLLILPWALVQFNARGDRVSLACAAVFFATLASVYTEFLLLGYLLVLGSLVLACLGRQGRRRALLGHLLLLVSPALLNPLYTPSMLAVHRFILDASVLPEHYPWAYQVEGLARLWFGDLLRPERKLLPLPLLCWGGALLTGAAAAGLVAACGIALRTCWKERRPVASSAAGLLLGLLGLAAFPLVLVLRDREHPYQVYKLLITISPLLALGLVCLVCRLSRGQTQEAPVGNWSWSSAWPAVARAMLLVTVGGAALSTVLMVRRSIKYVAWYRTAQVSTRDPDLKRVERLLASLRGEAIVCRGAGGVANIWLAYFGRFNRLWITWPNCTWPEPKEGPAPRRHPDPEQLSRGFYLPDFNGIPENAHFLCPRKSDFLQPSGGPEDYRVEWLCDSYMLWKPLRHTWACISHIVNPDGSAPLAGKLLKLGGGATECRILTGRAGTVKLTLAVAADSGPGRRAGWPLCVTAGQERRRYEVASGKYVISFPASAGFNRLTLEPLGTARGPNARDDRPPRMLRAEIVAVELSTTGDEAVGLALAGPGRKRLHSYLD